MKPIVLHGHSRAITQIKYNREGDLIFSASKAPETNVWYANNGERLGSYVGHNGTVWCIDVSYSSTSIFSGSADNSAILWDTETGSNVSTITMACPVRTVNFSLCSNLVQLSTDSVLGQPCELIIFDVRDPSQLALTTSPVLRTAMPGSKITAAIWGPLDKTIITGHEQGELCQWDVRGDGQFSKRSKSHEGPINDIQVFKRYIEETMFITASKDRTAKLHNMFDMQPKYTYKAERPVNSASISPLKPHVLLGGGQEARDVTTTSARQGKFDSRFFHLYFQEEFGRVKGHFGPINSVSFNPDGKGFSTGGEDGYVRMHAFDKDYFDFDLEADI